MNLWWGWALVLCLLISAVLGTWAARRGPRSRVLVVPWLLTGVAAACSAFLTWDELTASEDELADAVEQVADRLDGESFVLPAVELRRQVGAELGHPVDLASRVDTGPHTAERQETAYDVTLRARDGGPAGCLTVVVTRADDGHRMAVRAAEGRCAAS
ncbi:hypothetical protein [Nocardioides pantholopis]|uniref:hypothetical protein n=1 Tax=Nocardioides pantholopis TaxID=2483798 RepID=UPI000F08C63B|nr:hypothetical protein [Nocardioides pantholopis]